MKEKNQIPEEGIDMDKLGHVAIWGLDVPEKMC